MRRNFIIVLSVLSLLVVGMGSTVAGETLAFPSDIARPFPLGREVLFPGFSPETGWELWASNGTKAGTRLVRDIRLGSDSSRPDQFVANEGVVYFLADDGEHGRELWRTDASAEGTFLVKDAGVRRDYLSSAGGYLFFQADDGVHGVELWISDGTEAGTLMTTDINPGPSSSHPIGLCAFWNSNDICQPVFIGGWWYFRANDGEHGYELWKHNPSTATTVMVKDLWPGPESASPYWAGILDDTFVFNARLNGLWRSDGTEEGTFVINTSVSPTHHFVPYGDILLYVHTWPYGLSRTDGTEAGTYIVRSPLQQPSYFAELDGVVLFGANGGQGYELWRTDATEAGTALVKDINATGSSSPGGLVRLDGKVLFMADDGIHGEELWVSDGTEAGTTMLMDIVPGAASSYPYYFTAHEEVVFFAACADESCEFGWELWRSDGTAAGTMPVRLIEPAGLIANLMTQVEALTLHNGIASALDAKLENAAKALDDVNENNNVAAINSLEAFINQVEAQAGKKIPQADADALTVAAQQIIDLLTD